MRIATIWREKWYSGLGPLARDGASAERMQFGAGLLASLGIEEDHFAIEDHLGHPETLNAKGTEYDAVFIFPCEEVWPLRKFFPGAKIIVWMADDDWRWQGFGRFWMQHADVIATTSPRSLDRYRERGFAGAFLTNWATRREWVSCAIPTAEKKPAADFHGLIYGERRGILDAIDYPVTITDWRSGIRTPEAYLSSMAAHRYALCLTRSSGSPYVQPGPRQMKARLFEPQILGTILVTEFVPGLEDWWVPGEECVVFDGPKDAAEQMRALDRDPERRASIVKKALERILREHTYDARMKSVLAFAGLEVVIGSQSLGA